MYSPKVHGCALLWPHKAVPINDELKASRWCCSCWEAICHKMVESTDEVNIHRAPHYTQDEIWNYKISVREGSTPLLNILYLQCKAQQGSWNICFICVLAWEAPQCTNLSGRRWETCQWQTGGSIRGHLFTKNTSPLRGKHAYRGGFKNVQGKIFPINSENVSPFPVHLISKL